ncbi:MAG: hypothetical protein ABIJ14_01005 [Nanoarchaeota archaeon]
MVYKRYIYRNGQKFGPYYYESYRDENGIKRTKYVSGPSAVTSKKPHFFLVALLVISLIVAFFAANYSIFESTSLNFDMGSKLTGFNEQAKEFYEAVTPVAVKFYSFMTGLVAEKIPSDEEVTEEVEEVKEKGQSEKKEKESKREIEKIEEKKGLKEQEVGQEVTEETGVSQEGETTEEVVAPQEVEVPIEESETPTVILEDGETVEEVINKTETIEPPEEIPEEAEPEIIVNESVEEPSEAVNETEIVVPEANITLVNVTEVNITIINETVSNITSVGNVLINTTQYGAVLNKPVKWKKKIKLGKPENVTVKLPKEATNITVYKLDGNAEEIPESPEESKNSNESSEIEINQTESVTNESEVNETKKIAEKVKEKSKAKTKISTKIISGKITTDIETEEPVIFGFFKKLINSFKRLTGKSIEVEEKEEFTEVVISENATEFEIEYETPAPIAFEENISKGKRIVISSVVHYENILAFTELPREVANIGSVHLYHMVNGTKQATNFDAYDLDNNSLVDYIEWIVPSLSSPRDDSGDPNQTYEVEITILNVQSYPTVGGNWTVMFNTTGEANLTISAWNGTTYGFDYVNDSYDLEFLETKCGDDVKNVTVEINATEVSYDVYLKKKRIEEIRRLLE